MSFAIVVFLLACAGITALFALKWWEREHARVLFPEVRRRADVQALRIKSFVTTSSKNIERKLLPYLLHLARMVVHGIAISFGHLAHSIGERSHDLADLVSHKHRFERGEPRSEFLKQINERPMRNRNGMNGIQSVPSIQQSSAQESNPRTEEGQNVIRTVEQTPVETEVSSKAQPSVKGPEISVERKSQRSAHAKTVSTKTKKRKGKLDTTR